MKPLGNKTNVWQKRLTNIQRMCYTVCLIIKTYAEGGEKGGGCQDGNEGEEEWEN